MERLLCRDIDLASHYARPDRAERCLLDVFDLRKEVFQLAVRFTQYPHAREIADVAVEIPTGIHGKYIAFLPPHLRRRPIMAGAGPEQAIFERHATLDLCGPQGLPQ